MFNRSLGGWLSLVGMLVAVALIIITIMWSLKTMSTRFWPLLAIGLAIGFTCTPIYYYLKTRDKQLENPLGKQVDILSAAGLSAKNKHQIAENGGGQRLKPIYPPEESKK